MSTKIYNGLIATSDDVFETSRRVREVMAPIFREKIKKALDAWKGDHKPLLSEVLQDRKMEKYAKTSDAFNSDFDRVAEIYAAILDLKETAYHTFSEYDVAYDVLFMPNGNGKTHPPLVLVFSEGYREYTDALLEEGVVKRYGYWDNTDKDDDVTEEEWDQRRKAWSHVDIPSNSGLLIAQPSRFDVEVELLY